MIATPSAPLATTWRPFLCWLRSWRPLLRPRCGESPITLVTQRWGHTCIFSLCIPTVCFIESSLRSSFLGSDHMSDCRYCACPYMNHCCTSLLPLNNFHVWRICALSLLQADLLKSTAIPLMKKFGIDGDGMVLKVSTCLRIEGRSMITFY